MKAFIEIAWRRYTKHSRNKAQEIQGAIALLAETYADARPFRGVVLAGFFTAGAIQQLRSLGFHVLYFPYESVADAFASVGVDARFDEGTSDATLRRRLRHYDSLPAKQRSAIPLALCQRHRQELAEFLNGLRTALRRAVQIVHILPLHGRSHALSSVSEAIAFIEGFDESGLAQEFVRYEVIVRYTNGDEVRGQFQDKHSAVEFLGRIG
jgi:hypothetical protein